MNQYSSFINSRNLFLHPPVDFEDWNTQVDYDELVGAEKYSYNTYRHYILPYLKNPKEQTVFDINCGKGYGLSILKAEYGFKKCVGYNSVSELLEACKNRHNNVSFYKDFIMSKQENADFVFAFETFQQFDNKSALLLKFRQSLAPNGKLIIVQSVRNMSEFDNHMSILEKTHGLKKLYQANISPHVNMALHKIGSYGTGVGQGAMIDEYVNYSANLSRDEDFCIMVNIFENQ